MIKFVTKLNKESIVDVEGVVVVPSQPVAGTSQPVEIHATKVYCISKSGVELPINLDDAVRSELGFQEAEQVRGICLALTVTSAKVSGKDKVVSKGTRASISAISWTGERFEPETSPNLDIVPNI